MIQIQGVDLLCTIHESLYLVENCIKSNRKRNSWQPFVLTMAISRLIFASHTNFCSVYIVNVKRILLCYCFQ